MIFIGNVVYVQYFVWCLNMTNTNAIITYVWYFQKGIYLSKSWLNFHFVPILNCLYHSNIQLPRPLLLFEHNCPLPTPRFTTSLLLLRDKWTFPTLKQKLLSTCNRTIIIFKLIYKWPFQMAWLHLSPCFSLIISTLYS